jgi:hypothetical protein
MAPLDGSPLGQVVFLAGPLPEAPLDAAARFYRELVPAIRHRLRAAHDVVILFAPADHAHQKWRLAAIQELAREAAPVRVNAVVAAEGVQEDCTATMQFLHEAPGITGQLLQVAGNAAEKV